MSANVRIALRNFLDLMTLSTQIAPASGLEIENTQNDERGMVWRSPDATDQYVRWSLASGSILHNWLLLYGHHCHGGNLRYRAWANNDWTGTVFVDTGTNGIFNAINTGFDWGYSDYPDLDSHDTLGLESACSVFFPSGGAVKSGELYFSGKSTTYGFDFWEVCQIFLGKYFELTINPAYGLEFGPVSADRSPGRSRGGSNVTAVGARWDSLKMDLDFMDPDDMPTWVDGMKRVQTSRDVAVSVFPEQGGRIERDHTIVGKMASLDAIGRQVSWLTKKVQIVGN